jgi:hypothetical protein
VWKVKGSGEGKEEKETSPVSQLREMVILETYLGNMDNLF